VEYIFILAKRITTLGAPCIDHAQTEGDKFPSAANYRYKAKTLREKARYFSLLIYFPVSDVLGPSALALQIIHEQETFLHSAKT